MPANEATALEAGHASWFHIERHWPGASEFFVMHRGAPSLHTERVQEDFSGSKLAAFTLVELLVTLAVVSVLATLLLPAMARSKGRAKEAVCIGNLKQINVGFHLYLADNEGRFPAGFRWPGRWQVWNSKEFYGGRDGIDTNTPPARVRPLFPYLGASEVYRCPADVGYDEVTKGGFLVKPSLFVVAGLSYLYNAGEILDGAPQSTDGLGGKTVDWVQRPAQYLLAYEPPGWPRGGEEKRCVYWHRARKPGSALGRFADKERGPRVSPVLFVDGHVLIIDCSGSYFGFPEPVETRQ